MAGSYEGRWRRRRRSHADLDDKPEEGEFVPGYHSNVDTEEYYNHYSSSESDETISDRKGSPVPANNGSAGQPPAVASNGNASALSVPASRNGNTTSPSVVVAPAFACRVCGMVFGSRNAVCGHMKVHAGGSRERQELNVAAAGRWGGTGKRVSSGTGGRAASPSPNAEPENSMAIVTAEPKLVLQPVPLAFTTLNLSSVPTASAATDLSGQSSSAQPIHNDAMDTDAAGASNPPTEAVVHQQHAPPPPPPPAAAAGVQAPPAHRHPVVLTPAGRQNPEGYTCKQCNVWFATHQGLGGHMAGHKNRELAAAAAGTLQDGALPCRSKPKPEKTHVCKICGAEFPRGEKLGGHMRKHWNGPPIVPKKKQRIIQDLTVVLSVKADEASPAPAVEAAQPGPAPAVERKPEPAPGPPVARRVFLFGIDIGPAAQTPEAQEGSPATEGSASTGGEQ